jgi:hypothetical protein
VAVPHIQGCRWGLDSQPVDEIHRNIDLGLGVLAIAPSPGSGSLFEGVNKRFSLIRENGQTSSYQNAYL